MTALKSLTFAVLPKWVSNPIADRRMRTITRLEEQKLLLADAGYVRKVRSFEKIDGVRTAVEKQQRVSPWWKRNPDGTVLFAIRVGSKTVEFEKGKAAVTVSSTDKLSGVIDTLIAATRNGELDTQLAQASGQGPTRKK